MIKTTILNYSVANKLLFLFVFIFGNCSSFKKAAVIKDDSQYATVLSMVPFKELTGGIIVVELRLNDIPDKLNFILDTGSGGVSLDSSTVSRYHLNVTPSESLVRSIGSLRKANFVMDQTLKLPHLKAAHLDFHVNNYSPLSSEYGLTINGVIGFSFLKRFITEIDYDTHLIKIRKHGKIRYPKTGNLLKISTLANSGIPVIDAVITDSSHLSNHFFLDTGAGLGFLIAEDYAKDSNIFKKDSKTIMTHVVAPGGKTSLKLSTIRAVKIGDYTFTQVPTHIYKDENQVMQYPRIGGLIGSDLLRRFNLVINYADGEIHLKPNTHFKEPFNYSYCGIGIQISDGHITIEDILRGSPGEKAGLRSGDEIVSIDNHVEGTVEAYNDLLQDVHSALKIVVLRNRKRVVTYLIVKDTL